MMQTELREKSESLIKKILELQDENGCWNVLKPEDKYYPYFQYYCPNFKSTLWTMIFLADLKCSSHFKKLEKPFSLISSQFYDEANGIYTIGKSHFPIPCLNGNMLYLHAYFGFGDANIVEGIIDFFTEYQRFDDGDYKTPSDYPYFKNSSCYGKHTCYWGVVKLLKGLSFIPKEKRSGNAVKLIGRCIDFILRHEVCFSSKDPERFLQPQIVKLTFPCMYKSDYLEILWILNREGVEDKRMNRALKLLESRKQPDGSWIAERNPGKLVIPFANKRDGAVFVTDRARGLL